MSKNKKIIGLLLVLPLITLIYGLYSKQYITVFNSLLTALCIISFTIFNKKFSMFNAKIYYSIIIFIMLAVFMGRTLKFYNFIFFWDKILHFTSGFILFAIGKKVYVKLNGDVENSRLMDWFAILFAVASAGVWEFYEFFIDCTAHISAQGGLTDTMLDMLAGTASALFGLIFEKIKKRGSKVFPQ